MKKSPEREEIDYLTGLTALNIPLDCRDRADWHTTHICNKKSWNIAGKNLISTQWLLGLVGVYDATAALEKAGVEIKVKVFAASYERALFDLLYHFLVVLGKPVPNIQATDIDDAVNFDKVRGWINDCQEFIPEDAGKMKAWLDESR